MAHSIFVSLTEQDTRIAEALRGALGELVGDAVTVNFSTSTELGRGPRHGEDWFDWIVKQVRECDFAFILVTPTSVNKPWILWEAGAVQGAALTAGAEGLRKVRPLVYQIDMEQVPSPIRESKVQCRRGDRPADVTNLFSEMLDGYKGEINFSRILAASQKLPQIVQSYLDDVHAILLKAPAVPTSVALDEWLQRLNALIADNRQSEVEYLEDWMQIAFGRDPGDKARPLDLRLHTRLADVYLKNRNYPRAVGQLELARTMAPRDMYILRTLGRAYMDSNDRDRAKVALDRMAELDQKALERNVECAALAARWHREGGDLRAAARVLSAAFDCHQDSYYLANLLGEVWLESNAIGDAKAAFRQALDILQRLRDTNVWTNATAANAAFVLDDDAGAVEYLRAIAAANPDAGTMATVERGLRKLAVHLANGDARVGELIGVLRPQAERAAVAASTSAVA